MKQAVELKTAHSNLYAHKQISFSANQFLHSGNNGDVLLIKLLLLYH